MRRPRRHRRVGPTVPARCCRRAPRAPSRRWGCYSPARASPASACRGRTARRRSPSRPARRSTRIETCSGSAVPAASVGPAACLRYHWGKRCRGGRMRLNELREYVDGLLDAQSFRDYCPNGLQVEGRADVTSVLCGVTASQALLDAAVAGGYDAVFVHHGYFWRGEDARLTGIRKRRIATLLRHDISLFAYHLPLDAHAELGNNAQLARVAGWTPDGSRFGDQQLGWLGRPAQACTAAGLAASLDRKSVV